MNKKRNEKNRNLDYNEVRAIKLDRNGIEEILMEVLCEKAIDLFDINDQNVQYRMLLNDDLTELVYIVYQISETSFKPLCDVDKAVSIIGKMNHTTDSIYTADETKKYVSIDAPSFQE